MSRVLVRVIWRRLRVRYITLVVDTGCEGEMHILLTTISPKHERVAAVFPHFPNDLYISQRALED